jgi:hypothetical protein
VKGQPGDTLVIESERAAQPARAGTIEEVLQEQPARFRVRWEDGHESIVSPADGAAHIERRKAPKASAT